MQKKKIAGYMKAKKLVEEKGLTVRPACKEAGISVMTYYKYVKLWEDGDKDGLLEAVHSSKKNEPTVITYKDVSPAPKMDRQLSSDLERILAENEALEKQLRLRAELAKFG